MKQCTDCKEFKSLDRFGKCKKHKDGLLYICKDCSKIRSAEYYLKNRERIIIKQKKYYGHYAENLKVLELIAEIELLNTKLSSADHEIYRNR